MEKRTQVISEEDGGLREDARSGEGVGEIVVGTSGPDHVPWSGGCDETGQGVCEGASDEALDAIDLSMLSPRQRARFEREMEKQQSFTDEAKKDLARSAFYKDVQRDEPMATHTSLGVGGPADALVTVHNREELKEVMEFAAEKNVPYVFLGNGSSTLIRDGGFRGMIIKMGSEFGGVHVEREDDKWAYVRAGAAAPIDAAVDELPRICVGTVAGVMTVFPTWLTEKVVEVCIIDRCGKELALTRKAVISDGRVRIARNNAIVSILVRLQKTGVSHHAAQKHAADEQTPKRLNNVFRDNGNQWASDIIAEAGLTGVRVGGMRVDRDDSNAFVNEGAQRTRDALVLINMVRDRVKEKLGINLETAVRIIGED